VGGVSAAAYIHNVTRQGGGRKHFLVVIMPPIVA